MELSDQLDMFCVRLHLQNSTVTVCGSLECKVEGTVEKDISPRSYQVSTPYGPLQMNHQHLRHIPNAPSSVGDNHHENSLEEQCVPSSSTEDPLVASTQTATEISSTGEYHTRSGRTSVMPDQYKPTW